MRQTTPLTRHRSPTLRPHQPDSSSGPIPTFTHALAEQPDTGFWLYGPEIFRTDRRRHGLRADTASTISADYARTLARELRDANAMFLHLGAGHGGDGVDVYACESVPRHLPARNQIENEATGRRLTKGSLHLSNGRSVCVADHEVPDARPNRKPEQPLGSG